MGMLTHLYGAASVTPTSQGYVRDGERLSIKWVVTVFFREYGDWRVMTRHTFDSERVARIRADRQDSNRKVLVRRALISY